MSRKYHVDYSASTDLESDLGCEYELVPLKKSSGRIYEYRKCYTVNQIVHTLHNLTCRFSFLNSFFENNTERLKVME